MKLRHVLFGGYLIVCALSLTGLLFRDIMTADGTILGLPRGLAWVSGWALATPLALLLFDLGEGRDRHRDSAGNSDQGSDASARSGAGEVA